MEIKITKDGSHYVVACDGEIVAHTMKFGNGRYGLVRPNGDTFTYDTFKSLKDIAASYERIVTWLSFGDVARNRLHEQAQYASRMIDGRHGSPNLGYDLRFQNENGGAVDVSDYHCIRIHRDDVEEFVRRVEEYRLDSRF